MKKEKNENKFENKFGNEYEKWLNYEKRKQPGIDEWLSGKDPQEIRQNRKDLRQEIIEDISNIINQKDIYTIVMIDSLRDLRYKVWEYIKIILYGDAPDIRNIEYYTERELNGNFEELSKCAKCLEISSKKLEQNILFTIFELSDNLQKGISPIVFLNINGEEPTEVFKWKDYFQQMGLMKL